MELSPPDSNESNQGLNNSPKEMMLAVQHQPYMQAGEEAQNGLFDPAQHQHQTLQTPTVAGNRLTVPAACVACRTKHLKCDGAKPCSRCTSYSIECSYVRSRRGYKGPRRVQKQNSEAQNAVVTGMLLLVSLSDSSLPSTAILNFHSWRLFVPHKYNRISRTKLTGRDCHVKFAGRHIWLQRKPQFPTRRSRDQLHGSCYPTVYQWSAFPRHRKLFPF